MAIKTRPLVAGLRRRTVLAGLAGVVPAASSAQDGKRITVGFLSWWPPSLEAAHVALLREGLRTYGYVEGRKPSRRSATCAASNEGGHQLRKPTVILLPS